MRSYLTNAWHMAGWSNEVGEQPLSRAVCGKRMLIFRKMGDSLAAMEDRCPHRFAPLSLGTRDGDVWTCGYHGLRFGADGLCVGNPFSDRIPAGTSVKTYPVAERNGIIWIWPGNPEAADENAIVDFPFLSDLPANRLLHGYTQMAANYEYGTDNLMDLSHIEFVHKGSFAGAGVIFAGTHEVIQEGETLHSNWWMPNVAAPPHTQGIYPPEMRTDHWLDMRWNAPATMRLIVGATPCDAPRDDGVVVEQIHILTPESEHSTLYFWATSSAFPLDDPELAAQFQSLFAKAFDEEDKPIIEAAYANVGDGSFWDEKPAFLGIDAGGTRARRLLETMRAAD
jgi:phenylpropionate dioxygenase-like ring-hydroxylating dioxygenase large terminal subunit